MESKSETWKWKSNLIVYWQINKPNSIYTFTDRKQVITLSGFTLANLLYRMLPSHSHVCHRKHTTGTNLPFLIFQFYIEIFYSSILFKTPKTFPHFFSHYNKNLLNPKAYKSGFQHNNTFEFLDHSLHLWTVPLDSHDSIHKCDKLHYILQCNVQILLAS